MKKFFGFFAVVAALVLAVSCKDAPKTGVENVDDVVANLTELVQKGDASAIQAKLTEVKDYIVKLANENSEQIAPYVSKIKEFIATNKDKLTSVLGDNAIANGLVSAVEALPEDAASIKEAAAKLADFSGVVEGTQDAVEGAIDGAQEAVDGAVEGAKDAVEGVVEGAKDAANDAVQAGKDAVEGAKDAAAQKVNDAKEAAAILKFLPNKAARITGKVLKSACANATHNFQMDESKLYVKACYADEGITLKRYMPRAKGSASPIMKRTSHITVVVAER